MQRPGTKIGPISLSSSRPTGFDSLATMYVIGEVLQDRGRRSAVAPPLALSGAILNRPMPRIRPQLPNIHHGGPQFERNSRFPRGAGLQGWGNHH